MKAKLEIVSGFLGSGKTSFINAYVNTEICLGKDILIILLEEGIKGINSNSKNIKVIYLEKIEALKELLLKEMAKKQYSRIILEFNGTINLSIIGKIFEDKEIRKGFNFYGNYYVGDSKNLKAYLKNLGEIIIPFIQSSKLIILNNLSLISFDEQKEVIKYIEEINRTAPILFSKSLDTLEEEVISSKYFKEVASIKKIKSMIYKREIVKWLNGPMYL